MHIIFIYFESNYIVFVANRCINQRKHILFSSCSIDINCLVKWIMYGWMFVLQNKGVPEVPLYKVLWIRCMCMSKGGHSFTQCEGWCGWNPVSWFWIDSGKVNPTLLYFVQRFTWWALISSLAKSMRISVPQPTIWMSLTSKEWTTRYVLGILDAVVL